MRSPGPAPQASVVLMRLLSCFQISLCSAFLLSCTSHDLEWRRSRWTMVDSTRSHVRSPHGASRLGAVWRSCWDSPRTNKKQRRNAGLSARSAATRGVAQEHAVSGVDADASQVPRSGPGNAASIVSRLPTAWGCNHCPTRSSAAQPKGCAARTETQHMMTAARRVRPASMASAAAMDAGAR